MVAARVTRLTLSVLAASPPQPAVLRQEAEGVVTDATGATTVRVPRMTVSVLAKTLATPAMTRQEAEAAVSDSGTGAPVRVARLTASVLAKTQATPALTRQEAEGVVVDTVAPTAARVARISLSVLAKSPPAGPTPITLPDDLVLLRPNWVEPIGIRSTYLTDLQQSRTTLAETRSAQRSKPVRIQTMRVLCHHGDVSIVLSQLRRHTREISPVGLWPDAVVCGTSSSGQANLTCEPNYRRFFAGGRVAVFPNGTERQLKPGDYDVYTLDTVFSTHLQMTGNLAQDYDQTWSVVPLIDVEKMLAPEHGMVTDQITEAEVEMTEIAGPSMLNPTAATTPAPSGWPTYRGLPVFETAVRGLLQWRESLGATFQRYGDTDVKGRKLVVSSLGDQEVQVQEHPMLLEREDFWDVLRFWDSRMGMLLTFYEVDLEFRWSLASASGTFIEVEPDEGVFETTFEQTVTDAGFFGIVMADGTVYIRAIQTVQVSAGKWRLTLAAGEDNLPTLNVADVYRAAPAREKRFASDSLEEVWTTDGVVELQPVTVQVLEEKDIDIDP